MSDNLSNTLLLEKYSKTFLIINDPYVTGANTGDIDDTIAILALEQILSKYGIKFIVYIPHNVFKNKKTRYNTIIESQLFKNVEIITNTSDNLEEIVKNVYAIGLMAPLSNADEVFVNALFERDNSRNFSQGQTSNPVIGGKSDYNFLSSKVDKWNNSLNQLDKDLLNKLFPTQYESRATKKSMDLNNLISLVPSVINYTGYIKIYNMKRIISVPDPELIYSAGLYTPSIGQANNMKAIMQFFQINGIISNFDLSKLEDLIYLRDYIGKLVQENIVQDVITPDINAKLDIWSQQFVDTFKNSDLSFKQDIINSLQIVVFLMDKIGIPFVNAFPTFDTCQVPEMKFKVSDPNLYDLTAVLGFLYGLSVNNLNFINENMNITLSELFEYVNSIRNLEL
jgi:hypothetical protein